MTTAPSKDWKQGGFLESRQTKPCLVADHIVLRTATEDAEINRLRQALNQGHYLKARRPAGHVLWQGIYHSDTGADCPQLVAVLCWASPKASRGTAATSIKTRESPNTSGSDR